MSLRLNLRLNGPNEPVDGYKGFYGHNYKEMPLLIAEGRTPLSAAGLMRRYLEVLRLSKDAPEELKPAYALLVGVLEDNYFDLGDGAARNSDERMKVAPDAQYLRRITTKTRMVNGAVDLSKDYAALVGEEFSKAIVDKSCGMPQDRWDAKHNPVWLALARGDKALLDEFVNARFKRAKERFRYDGKMMGVYAPPVPNEGAAGRLWFMFKLGVVHFSPGDEGYNSGACGYAHLDSDGSRLLVGVAPEAQRAVAGQLRPTLEQRLIGWLKSTHTLSLPAASA